MVIYKKVSLKKVHNTDYQMFGLDCVKSLKEKAFSMPIN